MVNKMNDRIVRHEPTDIKDRNGDMIHFGDKVRFADKVEWYRNEYFAKVMVGAMTREEALLEIENKPYEERIVENVQDYDWLLSSEIQTYWEIVK
jgi:predicted fused transcriptional regulator/phosphomethylpyrimidine kinase